MSLLLRLIGGGGPTTFSYVASGGITFSGSAAVSKTKDYVGSGGFTLSGTAVVTKSKSFVGSGTINFSGSAVLAITKVFTGSGTIILGGAAELVKAKNFTAGNGVTFSGAAVTSFVPTSGPVDYVYSGSGTMAFDGSGTIPGFGGAAITEFVPVVIPVQVIGGGPGPSRERWHYLPGPPVHYDYDGRGVIRFGGAAKTLLRRSPIPKLRQEIDRAALRDHIVDEVLRRKREIEDREDEDVLVALINL